MERGAVRQALRALQEDGLLGDVRKGSPPRVTEPGPVREEPQPTMVALAPRLTEAFAAPHVRIDAVPDRPEPDPRPRRAAAPDP